MLVRITDVKQCRNKASGNFLLRGRGYATITISQRLNYYFAEYAATLLHELLHLWVTMLRLKGFKITNRREHLFIYATERHVLREAKRYMRAK